MKKKKKLIHLSILIILIIFVSLYFFITCEPLKSDYTLNLDADEFISTTSNNNILEPGNKIISTLEITNTSNRKINYQLYLDNLDGDLKEKLVFYVYYKEKLVYSNTAINFSKINPFSPPVINEGEIHKFRVIIEILNPELAISDQGKYLKFDIRIGHIKDK